MRAGVVSGVCVCVCVCVCVMYLYGGACVLGALRGQHRPLRRVLLQERRSTAPPDPKRCVSPWAQWLVDGGIRVPVCVCACAYVCMHGE